MRGGRRESEIRKKKKGGKGRVGEGRVREVQGEGERRVRGG